MNKPLNDNIITKKAKGKNGTEYGLGKNGKAYKLNFGAYLINGEYHLGQRWVQVHYASYERVDALELLKHHA